MAEFCEHDEGITNVRWTSIRAWRCTGGVDAKLQSLSSELGEDQWSAPLSTAIPPPHLWRKLRASSGYFFTCWQKHSLPWREQEFRSSACRLTLSLEPHESNSLLC